MARAGQSIEDYCRVCKEPRDHRVIAVDAAGTILRVICGYCESQHNFRGNRAPGERAPSGRAASGPRLDATGVEVTLVSERERAAPPIDLSQFEADYEGDPMDLELFAVVEAVVVGVGVGRVGAGGVHL